MGWVMYSILGTRSAPLICAYSPMCENPFLFCQYLTAFRLDLTCMLPSD